MKLLPYPVGNTANTSYPSRRDFTATSCSGFNLSVIVRENWGGPKDRGRPFTFIFPQYKSYPRRLTAVTFAEVGVRFSLRYRHIVILASPVI